MKRTLVGLALLMMMPTAAHAATYACDGSVSSLALNPDGLLTVSFGSINNVYLCKIGAAYNGISSDSCKAIYAHLLGAKLLNKVERFQFSDALTCTTHPSWTNLTGWYYGPHYL